MEDSLISLLSVFGYEVRRQGSLLPDEPYPDSFFTFWNNDSNGESFYDNVEASTAYDYDINFYSSDPEMVYSVLMKAKALLQKNGFILSGDGYDVPSDEQTHTGRGINAKFMKGTEYNVT